MSTILVNKKKKNLNAKPPNPFWIFIILPIAAICGIALICGIDTTKLGNSKKKNAQK